MAKKKERKDEDKRMANSQTFEEVGALLFRSEDMLNEIAPRADMLTPEDMVILLSMALALEAHLKGLRYRYGVFNNGQ